MAILLKSGGWKCSYCGKTYPQHQKADACRESHNIVYVGLSKDDLNRLLMFIYTKNEELLTDTLLRSIQSVSNGR